MMIGFYVFCSGTPLNRDGEFVDCGRQYRRDCVAHTNFFRCDEALLSDDAKRQLENFRAEYAVGQSTTLINLELCGRDRILLIAFILREKLKQCPSQNGDGARDSKRANRYFSVVKGRDEFYNFCDQYPTEFQFGETIMRLRSAPMPWQAGNCIAGVGVEDNYIFREYKHDIVSFLLFFIESNMDNFISSFALAREVGIPLKEGEGMTENDRTIPLTILHIIHFALFLEDIEIARQLVGNSFCHDLYKCSKFSALPLSVGIVRAMHYLSPYWAHFHPNNPGHFYTGGENERAAALKRIAQVSKRAQTSEEIHQRLINAFGAYRSSSPPYLDVE